MSERKEVPMGEPSADHVPLGVEIEVQPRVEAARLMLQEVLHGKIDVQVGIDAAIGILERARTFL